MPQTEFDPRTTLNPHTHNHGPLTGAGLLREQRPTGPVVVKPPLSQDQDRLATSHDSTLNARYSNMGGRRGVTRLQRNEWLASLNALQPGHMIEWD